jgi:hypothetical protein|tara:strand:- start:7185 stop:7451 length:267 start_codon:yes stop_codon:yes gene_type:complete
VDETEILSSLLDHFTKTSRPFFLPLLLGTPLRRHVTRTQAAFRTPNTSAPFHHGTQVAFGSTRAVSCYKALLEAAVVVVVKTWSARQI